MKPAGLTPREAEALALRIGCRRRRTSLIPNAIAVTGILDGKPPMQYFDPRGRDHRGHVAILERHTRVLATSHPRAERRRTWINGQAELSRDDGATWKHDLAISYRRIG